MWIPRLWQWAFVVAMLFAQTCLSTSVTGAAPAAIDCGQVMITGPVSGATVSGAVDVLGRTIVPDFRFYKVEYSPVGGDRWVLIGTDVVRQSVVNGRLVVWQTTSVPDGPYRLRLHVVDPTGNFCEAVVSPVQVSNSNPTPEIVPEPTETPMLTVVPPQPTPTTAPTVAIEIVPGQTATGTLPTRRFPIELPLADLGTTFGFFVTGMCGMAVILAGVGLVVLVRNLNSRKRF